MNFIGVDPGKSGGIAVLTCNGGTTVGVAAISLATHTERDVAAFLSDCGAFEPECATAAGPRFYALIEKVHSSPQMGVTSAFTFGRSYGFLRGLLSAAPLVFDEVSPQKWQKALGCLTQGDKRVSKAKAQQLFPQVKVTHAIADALLIAEYARRTHV